MKLNAEQKMELTAILKGIRGSMAETWKGFDAAVRLAVPAVLDGDNVELVNRIRKVLVTAKDRNLADFDRVIRTFTPYKTGDDGMFTTIRSAKAQKVAAEKWLEFVVSGRTLRSEMLVQAGKDVKPELTPEQQAERDRKRIESAIKASLEHGMTTDQVMDIITTLLTEPAKAAA